MEKEKRKYAKYVKEKKLEVANYLKTAHLFNFLEGMYERRIRNGFQEVKT